MLIKICLAMLAFAANSLFCRLALKQTAMDPTSFTVIRLLSGALVLAAILYLRRPRTRIQGSWSGALLLTCYAASFSFAYTQLATGVGALLLFGAVQLSMTLWGLLKGEKLLSGMIAGILLSSGGILLLLLPGAAVPPLGYAALMLFSGIMWGAYSLLGAGSGDPLAKTTGNFIRAVPLVCLLILPFYQHISFEPAGVIYAVLSGGIASGIGYALWYSVVKSLSFVRASVLQLSVPCLASVAGFVFLHEALTLRMLLATAIVLGGIALVVMTRARR